MNRPKPKADGDEAEAEASAVEPAAKVSRAENMPRVLPEESRVSCRGP